MLKSCSYCGRIHDSKYDCGKKPKQERYRKDIDKFRSTAVWQSKREQIKQRDKYLCQICIREQYDTVNKFTYDNLSVHHAISLEQNYDKRLDDDNLLTLCGMHHDMAEAGKIPVVVVLKIIKEQSPLG
jgi:5-methylcytosine-specific restriction endonuclease McrA